MKKLKLFEQFAKSISEGISADDFTSGLVSQMQKFLPKDRWTVTYEHGEIVVKNDFDETASYRIQTYESNEGKFRQPNIPIKGSVDEKKEVEAPKEPKDEIVPGSDADLNEALIPVFKDVAQKDKEMIDQKDLAGFIKGKMDAAEEEKDPSKQKPVLVVVQNPKYWQREFVVMELEGDNIKTQDRNKKPVVLKIKDVIGVFAQ